jgi:glycosyltransferase involved in cell wall biosynthesis
MRSILELLYSYRVAYRLRRLKAPDIPDVIEFAEVRGEGFAYLRKKQSVPAVVRCHTPTFVLRRYHRVDEMPYDTSLTVHMEKFSIGQADALTAPSRDMAQTIACDCGLSADRIHVIPNALDVDLFSPNGQRKQKEDAITILHVGRLDRIKGIEVLARAIPSVVEHAPGAQFVFIGRGDAWQRRLTAQLREKDMDSNAEFLGGVDQKTLLNWYQRADLAVVPTLNYESFSYTCAQAMAAGLPLVASRIGGIPETVGDEAGILVQPGDVDGLAEALVQLIHNPKMRQEMGRAGQQRAKRRFEAVKVAKETLEVYRSIS